MSSFNEIPILDLSLSRNPDTKPSFLDSLRHALLEVGFLYIKNTGISDELIQNVIKEGKAFFDLPEDKKLEIEMKNAPSFLGYSRLGNEITRFKTDWREQIDLSTTHPLPTASAPLYQNLLAPNQWPDPTCLPHFRPIYNSYMTQMGAISMEFISLVAEAIGLAPDAFSRFFDNDVQQHKLKIVRYPDLAELGLGDVDQDVQGVGPHRDSMLTTYLLQATTHRRGLQVLNAEGVWIDCPPVDGTLVVAIGQGLQALTQGVCQSTTHRVLSPPPNTGPRFSIPFFQGVSYDASFESMDIPPSFQQLRDQVLARQRELQKKSNGDAVADSFTMENGRWGGNLGEATLRNRIKSHPDVGERWYPELLREIRREQEEEKKKKKARSGERVGVVNGVSG